MFTCLLFINNFYAYLQKGDFFMTSTYNIRPLPKNSIIECPKESRNGRIIPCFKIAEGTFDDIHESLEIRPRSALFAQDHFHDVYAVLNKDSDKTNCLFLFKFVPTNSGQALYISRCLGKSAVKQHWNPFLYFLNYMS